MWKPVVVAAAALAIAGSSIVYAQQRLGGSGGYGDGGPRFEQRHRPSVEDMAAFTDARIAALKAGLQLTPDQAKNWPAFEQALRDMAQLRIQRRQAREAAANQQTQASTTPFDRLGRRADNMAKTSVAYKHIADTGTPLYQSLSDAQKHRFTILARMLKPHHHMHARNELNGGWREGFGYGRGGEGGGHWPGYGAPRFGERGSAPGGRLQPLMDTEDQDSEL
jgi:hypothetical protein